MLFYVIYVYFILVMLNKKYRFHLHGLIVRQILTYQLSNYCGIIEYLNLITH